MFPQFPLHGPAPSGTPVDRNKLDEARAEVRALQDVVADLQRRLEKQAVLVRALFALLSARHGLTEAELVERFHEVEAARAGGGVLARKCPECRRSVNQRTNRCIYCGVPCPVESAFDFLEMGAWPGLAGSPPPPRPTETGIRPAQRQDVTTRPSE
jgi:hypothetical protein